MANQEPVQPNKIHFHLTGFQTGHGKVAFGTSLASEIYAEMRNIMQAFQKSMKGGVAIAQKLKLVDEKVQELMTEVQKLGTVPMNSKEMATWLSKFNATNVATKAVIESLGNPQWITMLDSSLSKVTKLVKSTNFLQLVQNVAKELLYMGKVMANVSGPRIAPDALKFLEAMKALGNDATGLSKLGENLVTIGAATKNPTFTDLGSALTTLGKATQGYFTQLFGAYTLPPNKRLSYYYDKWIKATQKGDPTATKKAVAEMQSWWKAAADQPDYHQDQWLALEKHAESIASEALMVGHDQMPPTFSVTLINAIETGSIKGINWFNFPVVDNQYKEAIAGIQGMDQIGTQFSKASITTLNSLMTGMTAMIKNFNKAMMQSQRSVNLSISDINKRS